MSEGFAEFVRAVHGHDPFPWQIRAAEALCSDQPPQAICVPTGAGKTSILDAAIFAMSRGKGARRVVYTIDRRLVVDGVSAHAQRLADALARAEDAAVKPIADALGGRLRVVRLRGGVPLDDEWVLYPEDPCILVTTVDQAGSRLLFRGYGVSPRQAPIHAALLGKDALHVLDEAHLSQAYRQTLKACRALGASIQLIEMTATPAVDAGQVLSLDEADRAHPILARRLSAKKQTRLVSTTGGKLSSALVAEASEPRKAGAAVIGVVVNTVGRARQVYESLRGRGEAVLLTGRVRPFERERLVEALLPAISAGRDRSVSRPLFVVATQTVEVGADLDFDALVTECASISALRQRFGRLDRLGAAGVSAATIVYAAKSDKVYGPAYEDAWKWLQEVATDSVLDFGLDAFTAYPSPSVEPLLPVPALTRSHLGLLACTGLAAPPIDIAPWLHGIERTSAEVSIVWRADLDPARPEEWSPIVALLAGIATIAVLTKAGEASATRWDMTSGRQQLLGDVGTMLTRNLPRKRSWNDRLREGLIEGGSEEKGSTYGFDPEGYRSHALSAFAPSQSNLTRTTPLPILSREDPGTRHVAQVWLAVESFPLHPVLRGLDGRAYTAGWNGDAYYWCAWDDCLSLSAVRLLVGAMGHCGGSWGERGLREYAAPQVSLGKYGAMRMGRLVARTGSSREKVRISRS